MAPVIHALRNLFLGLTDDQFQAEYEIERLRRERLCLRPPAATTTTTRTRTKDAPHIQPPTPGASGLLTSRLAANNNNNTTKAAAAATKAPVLTKEMMEQQ